jgi:hypothetical protein
LAVRPTFGVALALNMSWIPATTRGCPWVSLRILMSVSRWSFVAATLLGVVAMHGLGSHGVHSVEPADAMMPMHHSAAADRQQQSSGVVDSASGADGHSGSLALGTGCLAVLLGLGFAVRAFARSSTHVSRPRSGALAFWANPARSQTRSPPTLAELSILRC